ncbi:rab-GTPase-TBC domain-containing protein [Obelidium mucronatum]|nr:rab-GTPase-TBC domain-containing protein [Obelidium mucronatum]
MLKEEQTKHRLGVWDETTLADTEIGSFVVLSTDTTPPPPKVSRVLPLSAAEWRLWFDEYVPVPKQIMQPIRRKLRRNASLILDTDDDTDNVDDDDEISDFDQDHDVDFVGIENDGKIIVDFSDVERRVFAGGIEPSLRGQVWRFLFGLYPWESTHAERKKIKKEKTTEYWKMKYEWLGVAEQLGHEDVESTPADRLGEDADADMYRDANMRVNKDVPRTDRGHPFYSDVNTASFRPPGVGPFSPHQNLLRDILITYACSYKGSDRIGYVQGMSDLASIVLIVCEGDEVDAFWIFAKMMESKKQNFLHNGSGMHKHLTTISKLVQIMDPIFYSHLTNRLDGSNFFFCFRWFLVWFKREFNFQDTCTLWEVCRTGGGVFKTDGDDSEFMYFIALAILDEHRDAIVRCLLTFDELLKYINDLSNTIPINSILEAAELLYLRFRVRAASLGVLPGMESSNSSHTVLGTENGAKPTRKASKKQSIVAASSDSRPSLSLLQVLEQISVKESEGRSNSFGKSSKKDV